MLVWCVWESLAPHLYWLALCSGSRVWLGSFFYMYACHAVSWFGHVWVVIVLYAGVVRLLYAGVMLLMHAFTVVWYDPG